MDYIRLLLDLSQSRAPFIRDSIRTDTWGPLVSGASGLKFLMGGKYAAVRIDGPRGGGEFGLFQNSKAIKTTLTYAMLVRLNSPTG